MKNPISFLSILTIGLLFYSCSGHKKTAATADFSKAVEITLWIDSEYMPAAKGAMERSDANNCYAVNYDKDLKTGKHGIVESEFESLCKEIAGFDYKEGFYYQLKTLRTKTGFWRLEEVLTKEKDRHYEIVEEHTIWVGPKQIEMPCRHPLAPKDCKEMRYQVQYGKLDKNGEWKLFPDYLQDFGYEAGNIYQVKYTKIFYSDYEFSTLSDSPNYKIRNVEVLSKRKQ